MNTRKGTLLTTRDLQLNDLQLQLDTLQFYSFQLHHGTTAQHPLCPLLKAQLLVIITLHHRESNRERVIVLVPIIVNRNQMQVT